MAGRARRWRTVPARRCDLTPPPPPPCRGPSPQPSSPDRQPSSWKPYPRWAPAYQVPGGPGGPEGRSGPRASGRCRRVANALLEMTCSSDRLPGVDRHAVPDDTGERLQAVHVVGHGQPLPGRRQSSSRRSTGPRPNGPGQDAIVGVQDHLGSSCSRSAQRLPLRPGPHRAADPQRIVRVGRETTRVEALGRLASRACTVTPVRDRADGRHRRVVPPIPGGRRSTIRSTYVREPPWTTRQWRALPKPMRPWLSRNRSR